MIIAFTGHRPDKLGGYKIPNPTYIRVCKKIDAKLRELKPDRVISGMALGIDQWAAFIAIKLNIPFTAAVPFENQDNAWPFHSQYIYRMLLRFAIEKVVVSPGGYSAAKMQIRNQWMVDHCDILIAIWDGTAGGTANCINYAKSIGKQIIFIDPNGE
jgi:uncharacterized phage-like protein YoqJ